jgi:hypothetical protein
MRIVLEASAAVGAVAGDKKQLVAETRVHASGVIAPDLTSSLRVEKVLQS